MSFKQRKVKLLDHSFAVVATSVVVVVETVVAVVVGIVEFVALWLTRLASHQHAETRYD